MVWRKVLYICREELALSIGAYLKQDARKNEKIKEKNRVRNTMGGIERRGRKGRGVKKESLGITPKTGALDSLQEKASHEEKKRIISSSNI